MLDRDSFLHVTVLYEHELRMCRVFVYPNPSGNLNQHNMNMNTKLHDMITLDIKDPKSSITYLIPRP
jgi:hypothetical protein